MGRGYISQSVRVTPTYEGAKGDAPASFVAKVPTFLQVPEYLTPWTGMIIETEIDWYREASAECPARIARCYGGVHESRTSYALLLEDLGDLATLSQTDSCPPEQAPLVVKTLARMHAHWWESERLREWTWLPSTERQSQINTPLVQMRLGRLRGEDRAAHRPGVRPRGGAAGAGLGNALRARRRPRGRP